MLIQGPSRSILQCEMKHMRTLLGENAINANVDLGGSLTECQTLIQDWSPQRRRLYSLMRAQKAIRESHSQSWLIEESVSPRPSLDLVPLPAHSQTGRNLWET